MKYFQENFDDNCYELTVLRWFRDNFVSKEDKEHYYEIAPIIVETINFARPVLEQRLVKTLKLGR